MEVSLLLGDQREVSWMPDSGSAGHMACSLLNRYIGWNAIFVLSKLQENEARSPYFVGRYKYREHDAIGNNHNHLKALLPHAETFVLPPDFT